MVRVVVDKDAGMTYIRFSNHEVEDTVDHGNVVVDLDRDDGIVGIEVFGSDYSVLELGRD